MIQADQFDIKTGKPIQVVIDQQWQPALKQIEHSYLEHWCQTNNIDTDGRFSVAQFYESIQHSDRLQLESEGKYLIFSSGKEGYFTDYATAQLITLGSDSIEPIYAADHNAVHNSVAYGGLIASDGVAAISIPSARILIIDNVGRNHGLDPLVDAKGQPIPREDLQDLYDKMGDGTMLVRASLMASLITADERDQVSLNASEKAGVSANITDLGEDLDRVDQVAAATTAVIEPTLRHQADTSVYQFRAASPDLPGIAKGTMTSSNWTERLGVDAIVSTDDIKGDDSRFSEPGIKEVSNFWINRKATAKYGQQTVGPQVKYNIPEATRLEINPRVQEKAEKLAQVAGNYEALSQRYLKHKAYESTQPYQGAPEDTFSNSRPDWLYNALASDKYGQMTDQASVVRGLEYYIQGEWQRLSSNGTSVPSAMAQHHSKLKPWEVCNRSLPHGAIVAYYRSPFPNVGAAAIAINNIEIIKQQDREAFNKQGVAYLPPETAKNIAITDFDGDINGFFVGYQATVSNLPEQLRKELSASAELPLDQQYEAARALFENMISQLEQGTESRIEKKEKAGYPLAVREFIQRTAPDVRPPQIVKQQKEKHPWQDGESHSEAIWRAWGITADNPTGKVANAGMSLQSLALELAYAPDETKGVLLNQVSNHCSKLLAKVDAGKVVIPDDNWLVSQGFSPYYRERLEDLSEARQTLKRYTDPQKQRDFTEVSLQQASALLSEVANGPNAINLQTAVDTAKSARGIDIDLHRFVQALQYQPDNFRRNRNNPAIYRDGNEMPTSIDEPVSWGVQQVNAQYSSMQLQEREHKFFQAVFPKGETPQQKMQAQAIIKNASSLNAQAGDAKKRHRQRRPEDQKPTAEVTLPDGRRLSLQNIDDAQKRLPIWRTEGQQPNWTIRIKQDTKSTQTKRFPAQLAFVDANGVVQSAPIGYVAPESAAQYQLSQKFQRPTQKLIISAPTVVMKVPWAQENDSTLLYEQRDRYLERSLAPPEGKDPQAHAQDMATALWRQSKGGRKLVMQEYPDILSDRLRNVPDITVGRLQISRELAQQLISNSPHTIQFAKDVFPTKGGDTIEPSVSVLTADGDRLLIGAVSSGSAPSISLPEGSTYMAAFYRNAGSDKVVDMHVMDLPTIEQTLTEMAAMKEGRRHITLDSEPYATYGIGEGDVLVAKAQEGGEQIALQVGDQHIIDAKIAARPDGPQRWAAAEKSEPAALFAQLAAARGDGKELWGLTVQPLGTYQRGKIKPFETIVVVGQEVTAIEPTKVLADVPSQPLKQPEANQLKENLTVHTGVMAAISRRNPAVHQRLTQVTAEQFADGSSEQAGHGTTLSPSPGVQKSEQSNENAGQRMAKANKLPQTPRRNQARKPSGKSRDNGYEY